MKKFLPIIGIIVIVITAGFFSYKTFLNYKNILKEGETPGGTTTQEEATNTENGEGTTTVIGTSTQNNNPTITMKKALENKSILIVIAFNNFQDEEYSMSEYLFYIAGGKSKVASTQLGEATGVNGTKVQVNFLINEVNLDEFDAVVFIGGSGALGDLDNENSYKLIRDAVAKDKVVSAICISPVILAKAGVLSGKKATVWTSVSDTSAIDILEQNGAIYENKSVVADGKIITGSGPEASEEFAMNVIEVVSR